MPQQHRSHRQNRRRGLWAFGPAIAAANATATNTCELELDAGGGHSLRVQATYGVRRAINNQHHSACDNTQYRTLPSSPLSAKEAALPAPGRLSAVTVATAAAATVVPVTAPLAVVGRGRVLFVALAADSELGPLSGGARGGTGIGVVGIGGGGVLVRLEVRYCGNSTVDRRTATRRRQVRVMPAVHASCRRLCARGGRRGLRKMPPTDRRTANLSACVLGLPTTSATTTSTVTAATTMLPPVATTLAQDL